MSYYLQCNAMKEFVGMVVEASFDGIANAKICFVQTPPPPIGYSFCKFLLTSFYLPVSNFIDGGIYWKNAITLILMMPDEDYFNFKSIFEFSSPMDV